MGRFFLATFLIIMIPLESFARVGFFALLPNPAGDDTLGEYIELRNLGCSSGDISGYSLSDASGKTYIIPSGTVVPSHENIRFPYSTTKIALNNSGDESVTLKDATGNTVDYYQYSGAQKDDVILSMSPIDDDCIIEPPPPNDGTGSTDTGSGTIDDGSGSLYTGSGGMDTGSGGIDTGSGDIILPPIDTGSGELSDTGTTSGTGTDESSQIGATETGSLTDTGTLSDTGVFVPPDFIFLSMQYDDTDGNRKIDTLFIEYSLTLSGTFDTGSVAIYSRTGGLWTERINTLTGCILGASLSGSILILHLREGDLEKTDLHITNTTTSDLRLKTLSSMGFTSIYGQEPPDFLLTSSFDEYRNVSSLIETQTSTDSQENTEGANIENIFSFPDIFPTLQYPTNATLSGDVFTCTSTPCRVNLTLEPIFTGAYRESDYICEVVTPETSLSSCNPNTFYFSGPSTLQLILREKSHPENTRSTTYTVVFQNMNNGANTPGNLTPIDTNPPVAIIDYDGKKKEYHEFLFENELNCYAYTCAVNLTAERSYDPEGSPLRYMWYYGGNELKTSKDPGERKYGLGDHQIWLRVIDSAGNVNSVYYIIHVLGPKPKIETEKPKKTKKEKSNNTISASIVQPKKSIKKIKMAFFSPPEIVLQGKTGTGGYNIFTCQAAKNTCQINLTLTGTQRNDRYEWTLPDGTVSVGKNPKGWTLPLGTYQVMLHVYKKGETVAYWSETYMLKAMKKPSTKKPKKPTAKKSIIEKPIILIPDANAAGSMPSPRGDTSSTLFFLGFLMTLLSLRRVYIRK